ncbi:uncharacterized protein [Acropora muricata]|uniref:uncharacterized protein n=1 Tax=Acropora muricata TaxID=159855 RepID=UPI0034E4C896
MRSFPISVLQLFISRMPKMCAILKLVSAPLNPIPIAEHFRRSHPQCEHSYRQHIHMRYLEALLNKIQVDIEVDYSLENLRKDMHKQTLAKLREELTRISQDEWMYKPIDQIIGF